MARICFVLFIALLFGGCDRLTLPIDIKNREAGEFVVIKTTPNQLLLVRIFPDAIWIDGLGVYTKERQEAFPYFLTLEKGEMLKIALPGDLPLQVSGGPSGETAIVGEWIVLTIPGGEKIVFKVVTQTLIIKFE